MIMEQAAFNILQVYWNDSITRNTPYPTQPHLYNKAVLEPRVSPAFAITYFGNHCNIRFDSIPVKVMCESTKALLCPSPIKMYITDHFSKKL